MAEVLITGGSGLIGTVLTPLLEQAGHGVRHLGRKAGEQNGIRTYEWNVASGILDRAALSGIDHIIHLAGAGIADKRWTEARVKELIDSRAASARLLLLRAKEENVSVRSFVSAAGINYYGAVTTSRVYTEADPSGTDTIARISREWEEAVDEWAQSTRVVKLRTPVVLSSNGGALAKLVAPVRFGLGAALGSGEQWMPWVHIDDLAQIYLQALTDGRFNGAYNVNTGTDVTNDGFMRTIAQVLKRPYFLPKVPGIFLKLALGELSSILLEGSRASNQRLLDTGFRFQHAELHAALTDLLP